MADIGTDLYLAYENGYEAGKKDATPKWISVKEKLPESGTRALVMRFDFVTKTSFYDLLWFDNGEWWNRNFTGDYAVTHWMPLPEPPEEDVKPVVLATWLEPDDDYGYLVCSVCEERSPNDERWNFCPNCGADMRETGNG